MTGATKERIPFLKMDGAENQFVVIDAREKQVHLNDHAVKLLASKANKDTGGCDQLVVLEPSNQADCFMRIYNTDGSASAACGNASRCVAWLIMEEENKHMATIETTDRVLRAASMGMHTVQVDMGEAKTGWEDIPLAEYMDTLSLPIQEGELKTPAAVNMGNPHMVFFVPNVREVPLEVLGPILENHPLFPEKANIGIAEIISSASMRLRVFERGVGETRACGTGACAAVVAANRRGLGARAMQVALPGGTLTVDWMEAGNVLLGGPVNLQFEGETEI